MARPEAIQIVEYIPLDELERQIKVCNDKARTKTEKKLVEKLKFIRLRYKGYSVPEAAGIMDINVQTGYNWQKQWNDGSFESIVPGKSTGKPSKLTPEQKAAFADRVGEGNMTTSEALEHLKNEYGVEFTSKHVGHILREQGLSYTKPYDIDIRSPDNAEDILKKTSAPRWSRSNPKISSSGSRTNPTR